MAIFLDVLPLLSSPNEKKRELAVKVLASLGDMHAQRYLKPKKDVFIKIEMAEALLVLSDKQGLIVLAVIVGDHESEFAKADALEHLRKHIANFPVAPKEASLVVIDYRDCLVFDKAKKIFNFAKIVG